MIAIVFLYQKRNGTEQKSVFETPAPSRTFYYLICLWYHEHLVFRYLWYHGHLVLRHQWHHIIDHRSSLCVSLSLSGMEQSGTEQIGIDQKTTQLCWIQNDPIFTQSDFI